MRDDDEIPRHLYTPTDPTEYDNEAPECVGTCFHRSRRELDEQTPLQICQDLKQYCESQALRDFCTLAGINDISFTWNPHIHLKDPTKKRRRSFVHFPRHAPSKLYDQFWQAYQDEPSLNLALAFHGTGESNVPTILKHGLDPKYRRTQAFGAGEYFAKDPGLSATYRQEGQKIMVYLLLMPKDVERVFSQKDRDIIVVKQVAHQLPLGYISFDSVNEHMIQHSQQMRLESRNLKLQAVAIEAQIKEAKKAQLPTEKLEWQAEQAWKAYLRMKMDAKRNHLQVQVLAQHVKSKHLHDSTQDEKSLNASLAVAQ